MAAWRYEISLLVLNIFQRWKRNFISSRGHVIPSKYWVTFCSSHKQTGPLVYSLVLLLIQKQFLVYEMTLPLLARNLYFWILQTLLSPITMQLPTKQESTNFDSHNILILNL